MLVCDHIAERLVREGVRHVFGVGGANIEDMFAAVQRRRPAIRVILNKHEHSAGTAADAYARVEGFGVVMTTSGGGAMNLVHSLAEARASEVPMLAIVGEPPRPLQGKGAFQDTSGRGQTVDALAVFRAVTGRAARVEQASELPAALDRALELARQTPPGPAVLLLAKDLQREEVSNAVAAIEKRARAAAAVAAPARLADDWLELRPVVVIAGPGIARANAGESLRNLVTLLDASVTTTPDARDAFDNTDSRFLGVCGAMGHPPVARALAEAELVVVAGTPLPLLARQGLEATLDGKRLLSLGPEKPFVAGAESRQIEGEVSLALQALIDRLGAASAVRRASRFDTSIGSLSRPLEPGAGTRELRAEDVLQAVERFAPETSSVLIDAGNTGASAAHFLRAPRRGRWLIAMGMAGMGYTFGAATGVACATGRRCFVLAGDGAFYMQGLEIHTAVEHALPVTYVIFDNRAHGMCLVRERLLLGENAGYNAFRSARIGAGLAAMFPGLPACDCTMVSELDAALSASLTVPGPSVISVLLDDVEVPPFSVFQERAPATLTVRREADDEGAQPTSL
jgi:acetolactate synthase-1/2/3 large subunit